MTECFMFNGTRKDARDKFNDWAKDKQLKDRVIHELPFRTRDSVAEEGILIIAYYDKG